MPMHMCSLITYYPFMSYPDAQHLCNLNPCIRRKLHKPSIFVACCVRVIVLILPKDLCRVWIGFENETARTATPFRWHLPVLPIRKLLVTGLPSPCPLPPAYIDMLRGPILAPWVPHNLLEPKLDEFPSLFLLDPNICISESPKPTCISLPLNPKCRHHSEVLVTWLEKHRLYQY